MKTIQKIGGIAAMYEAAAYVLGMVFYLVVLDYSGVVKPVQKVAFLVDNQGSLFILTLFVYIIFSIFLVIMALALYDLLKFDSPLIMQTATAFGLIWACIVIASGMIFITGMDTVIDLYGKDPAQAATVWLAIESVFEGIGGGVEIVGGLWMLLISWVALRGDKFTRILNYLGLFIGVVGILTVIPLLKGLQDVFGLTQIVWFLWIGIIMLRENRNSTVINCQGGS